MIEQIQTVGYMFILAGCVLAFLAVALIIRYVKKRKKQAQELEEEDYLRLLE